MAQPYDGPAYKCKFPARHGGGSVLMRYLPISIERRLREKHSGSGGALLGQDMIEQCIVEVSDDIADLAGITGGERSRHGLVPVDSERPGRAEVWDVLGAKRRQLLEDAWLSRNTVKEADVGPFIEEIEDVC